MSSPFAPPGEAASGGALVAGLGDTLAFLLLRAFAIGSAALLACGTALAAGTDGLALPATLIGGALALPTSALHFRILYFPQPPDPEVRDLLGRPASVADARALLRLTAAERALVTALPSILGPWLVRALPAALAAPGLAALAGWVAWRGRRVVTDGLAREAELALAAGDPDGAAWRAETALRLGAGDFAALVLAFARFRAGDTPGALAALDRVVDRGGWRVDAHRTWIGARVLPRPEVEAGRARLLADPVTAPWGHAVAALVAVADGADVPQDAALALDACSDLELVRVWRVLRATASGAAPQPGDVACAERLARSYPDLGLRIAAVAGGAPERAGAGRDPRG